jgi:hypothetical protein
MTLRRAVLSLGLSALAACPAAAGTDDQKDQKKEQVVAKRAAQDGFRLCDLGQPVEVAKATYSAKNPASELKSAVCRSDQYQRLFMQVDTKDSENWTYSLRP